MFEEKALEEIQFEDDFDNNEENEEEDDINNKEIIIKKEKNFLLNEKDMIAEIIKKIKLLPKTKNDVNSLNEYSYIRTISSINRFCYGVMKLKKNFELIKYGKANITIHEIVNTVFDFLFSKKIDKIVICDSIKNI